MKRIVIVIAISGSAASCVLGPNCRRPTVPVPAALRDATRLSTDRYQGGLDSYLQVLDAQRNLFRSELDLTALQRQELTSIVELYRALGGGWNQ